MIRQTDSISIETKISSRLPVYGNNSQLYADIPDEDLFVEQIAHGSLQRTACLESLLQNFLHDFHPFFAKICLLMHPTNWSRVVLPKYALPHPALLSLACIWKVHLALLRYCITGACMTSLYSHELQDRYVSKTNAERYSSQ